MFIQNIWNCCPTKCIHFVYHDFSQPTISDEMAGIQSKIIYLVNLHHYSSKEDNKKKASIKTALMDKEKYISKKPLET